MLDSSRHFQSPEFIRHYLDWMALHKLNVLQWHLTDDEGWRLEIKKYPRLTEVGSQRVPAGPAAHADIDPATGKPRSYGGYYSQDTVRELVAYAAERGITIVPEIEIPGHASAAIVAYPQFAAGPHPPTAVPADWGGFPDIYNVDDASFGFLEDVLTEVMALFPSHFIHVGGDEVDPRQWGESTQAKARMQELGITEPKELQHYFSARIGTFLEAHGRRLVGWDEILNPGMTTSAVVMSWHGVDGGIAAAARGNDSVMAPHPTLYFDNRQGTGVDEPPGRIRVISLEDVYRFEPAPATLGAEQARHVLGLEAAVWTEHIRTEQRVATMSYPRAAAVAELGWSQPARRDWADFLRRLPALLARYDALGIPHSDSAYAVHAEPRYEFEAGRATVALSNQTGSGEIRYTLDGTQPSASSTRYVDALRVALPGEIRAATFSGTVRLAAPRTFTVSRDVAQRRSSRELKLCTENIGISVEDDAPIEGPRAAFDLDIQNPCWIFAQADLDRAATIEAAVGQIPFNFQIGELVNKIQFPTPTTAAGELNVYLDSCEGELIARLPLAPATQSPTVTVLPRAPLAHRGGKHDLCLRFAQPVLDPMYTIDWVRLADAANGGASPGGSGFSRDSSSAHFAAEAAPTRALGARP
jgi:hexosaminidase